MTADDWFNGDDLAGLSALERKSRHMMIVLVLQLYYNEQTNFTAKEVCNK